MNSSNDDIHEMRRHRLDDETAVEALLSGDSVPPELEPLSGAVREIRAGGSTYPEPTAELAERMATGDFAGVPPANAGTAHGHRRWWPQVSSWRPRTRIVTGAVAVFTGFTGVAAAGALPDGAQRSVESFIESVSPITFPDRSDEIADIVEETETPSPADVEQNPSPMSGDGDKSGHDASDRETGTPGRNWGELPPKVGRPDTPNRPETPPGEPDTPNRPETPPGEPDTPSRPETPPGRPDDPGNDSGREPDRKPGTGQEGNADQGKPDGAPDDTAESNPGNPGERGEPGDTSDNGNGSGSDNGGDAGTGAGNSGDAADRSGTSANGRGR